MKDKNGTKLEKGDSVVYGPYLDQGIYIGFFRGKMKVGKQLYNTEWARILCVK